MSKVSTKVNLESLRQKRKEKKVGVQEIIKSLNLQTKSAYYRKESGTNSFALEEAKILADLLDTTIDQLFFAS